MSEKLKAIFPGLLLAFFVAVLGKSLGYYLPQLGGATLSILIGILLGNTYFRQACLQKGTKFVESRFLECSVVLLGATVTFNTIGELGLKGILFTLLLMLTTIVSAYSIGQKLHFSTTASLLMAGGNAICGSSAIGSIAPTIGASDEEKGQMITLVNLLGTVMMLSLPFLALTLYGNNLIEKSAMIGGNLQSVGQVVAASSLLDESVVTYSMLFKIIRIMFLAFVVLAFQQFVERKGHKSGIPFEGQSSRPKFKLPWYVVSFLLFCLLNSSLTLPAFFSNGAKFLSGWLETTALAAIGLRLNFRTFIEEGPRFLLYGLAVGLAQVIASITYLYLFNL
ncbi:putative sulfate exporter family transporter [Atopobacter sp. AH10]|uniref:YeiH family protein n=1 Tax=Atopobacter sp. AH10 TaxID=2315861 RepID=UPI000EF210DD|nr:putative sulfate exporter family transporter [Atopobacter sp. AH10]RLK62651.1 putative sulfate exporter family transporter [Atopobacter sp. AH10]